jgi:hypothetical protein
VPSDSAALSSARTTVVPIAIHASTSLATLVDGGGGRGGDRDRSGYGRS